MAAALVGLAGCTGAFGGRPATHPSVASAPPDAQHVDVLGCVEALAPDPDGPHWLVRVGGPEGHVSVAADGTVVAVDRTDIFASVDDHRTWRVDRATVEAVAALLEPPRQSLPPAHPSDAPLHAEVLTPCEAAGPPDPHVVRGRLLRREARITDPAPWRPDRLWLVVHPSDRLGSPNDPADPFADWPLPGSIADHVVGKDVYRPDADTPVPVRWVCLHGDDVAPVWRLQQPGTRNTWIRLQDAEGRWEVTIRPNWPGYASSSDPCV